MPLNARRFRRPQPDHPEQLNKDMRAKHSHTLATELRADAHVVELQVTHRLSDRTTDYASVVPTVDVRH